MAGVRLPRVRGLKGYSVTLAGAEAPAHALFVDYRTADGRALEPEIFPRPDGDVYVCGMADLQPLPDSPEGVQIDDAACAVLAGAAGRVSTALAAATHHAPAGLLPPRHRRQPAADRPRARAWRAPTWRRATARGAC